MDIRIDQVQGHGDASQECVVLTVVNDTNLVNYMVADTTYTADGQRVSNTFRHTKWFGSKPVSAGDRIALWTKKGTDTTNVHNGVTWHHFYWDSAAAVWNDDGDGAILFQLADWKASKAR
jgi:hypothetical protein